MRAIKIMMLLLVFSLVACGPKNNVINPQVDSVDIYKWHTDEFVETIEDQAAIQAVIEDINQARTALTPSLNFELPDYKLEFKVGKAVDFEIGYYSKVQKIEVYGRYWGPNEGLMYAAETPLPIAKENSAHD